MLLLLRFQTTLEEEKGGVRKDEVTTTGVQAISLRLLPPSLSLGHASALHLEWTNKSGSGFAKGVGRKHLFKATSVANPFV